MILELKLCKKKLDFFIFLDLHAWQEYLWFHPCLSVPICLSIFQLTVFPRNCSLDFSEFLPEDRDSQQLNIDRAGFFRKILIFLYLTKKCPNRTKNRVFLIFGRKLSLVFTARMKDDIVERFLPKNLYQAKFLFLSYGPKLSWPIRLQTFLNFNISKKH